MKESTPAVREIAAAESFQQRGFYHALKISGQDTYGEENVQRHELWGLDLEIEAGQAEALDEGAELCAERAIHRASALAVDGDEDGVPAPSPTERGRGALHIRMAL